jgi:hypothetical protein
MLKKSALLNAGMIRCVSIVGVGAVREPPLQAFIPRISPKGDCRSQNLLNLDDRNIRVKAENRFDPDTHLPGKRQR